MKALLVQSGRATVSDVPMPSPGQDEVLIRVRLAGICGTDLEILKGYGGYEGILGHEFVGEVAAGPADLKGRRVVGEINCVCGRCDLCQSGLSNHCRRRTVAGIVNRPGVFAEFVTLPRRNCHAVPDAVSDEQAVFTEPLAAALQILRQVKIEKRMQAAVVGTGRLGLLVCQVLAGTGCRLTAVGRNPRTLEWLEKHGITAMPLAEVKQRGTFDLVVDCTGVADGLATALSLVRPRGTLVLKTTCRPEESSEPSRARKEAVAASGPLPDGRGSAVDLTPVVVNEVTLLGSRCGPFDEALLCLARRGVDVESMITRVMPLEQGVEALAQSARPETVKILLKVGP